MAIPSPKHSSHGSTPGGLVVIACNVAGQIVTRITSHRDLVGAMNASRSGLFLRPGAIRVEGHQWESLISDYSDRLPAVVSHEDLPLEGHGV